MSQSREEERKESGIKMCGEKMRVLCVGAHPDDIELMAGGTVARWVNEGHQVHVLTFSDGVWTSPDGVVMRNAQKALVEEKAAAHCIGYSVENLQYQAMDIEYQDSHVCEVLKCIEKHHIDTVICPFENDVHHDHEVVSRITISASRNIKRVLMGQINHHLRHVFMPNFFIDITDTWESKINALKCFSSEWERNGNEWIEFLDITTRYYGKLCGVERAEGFVTKKYLYGC